MDSNLRVMLENANDMLALGGASKRSGPSFENFSPGG